MVSSPPIPPRDRAGIKGLDGIHVSPEEKTLSEKYVSQANRELKDFNDQEKQQAIARLKLENEDYKADIEKRREFAGKIFLLTYIWLGLVLMIVIACGTKWIVLSDTVLVTLLTTTTVNVIASFKGVTEYIFYRGASSSVNGNRIKANKGSK